MGLAAAQIQWRRHSLTCHWLVRLAAHWLARLATHSSDWSLVLGHVTDIGLLGFSKKDVPGTWSFKKSCPSLPGIFRVLSLSVFGISHTQTIHHLDHDILYLSYMITIQNMPVDSFLAALGCISLWHIAPPFVPGGMTMPSPSCTKVIRPGRSSVSDTARVRQTPETRHNPPKSPEQLIHLVDVAYSLKLM